MSRLRKASAVQRRQQAEPKTRVAPTKPRQRMKDRIRHVHPRVSTWIPTPRTKGPGATPGRLELWIVFSDRPERRTIHLGHHGFTPELAERWAAIQAGKMPEDDEFPMPSTPEELDEEEAERLAPIEARGKREQEEIKNEAEFRWRSTQAYADELEEAGDDRRARQARNRADDEWEAAQREIARVRQRVNDERLEVRDELRHRAQAEVDAYEEHIAELRRGLDKEVETYAKTSYLNTNDDVEVVDWRLQD